MQTLAAVAIIIILCLIAWKISKKNSENFKVFGVLAKPKATSALAKFVQAAKVQQEAVKRYWVYGWVQTSWWAKDVYKNKIRFDEKANQLYATPYETEKLVGTTDPAKPDMVLVENNWISADSQLAELYKYPNLGKISNIGVGGQRIIDKKFLIRHKITNWILCPVDIARDQAGNWIQGSKLAFVKSPVDVGMCLFTYNSDMRFVHVKSGMRMTCDAGQAYLWYCDLTPGATRNCQWFMSGSANKIQRLADQAYLWATMWDTSMQQHDAVIQGQSVANWPDTEMVFDITTEEEYYGDSIKTCNWFDDFMNKNPDAAKIKDKIKINKETKTVYVPALRPGVRYFSLKNRQSGRCLHPEGGSDNPEHDTRVVLWSECPSGPIENIPDKLKMFHGSDGAIYLKNGSCVNAWYNGAGNGNPVVYSKQWCGQPIDILPNGALRHRVSGRCLHPDGGRPNQGTKLVTWDGCQSDNRLQYDKIDLGIEPDRIIGYVDDGHIGNIRMSDGTWVPIQNIFTLIAGPSEQFIVENFELFLSTEDAKLFREKFLQSDSGRENFRCWPWQSCAWSWASSAASWIKDRAKDVGNFAKNAVNSIGEWAKNLASSIANWAQNFGKGLVENLVKIGSMIGDTARNLARKIADTAMSTINKLKELALEAAKLAKELALKAWEELKKIQYALKIFEYLKDMGEKILNVIWDKIKEAVNSIKTAIVNFIKEKVVAPLKEKVGDFLWWAEHNLKRAVNMIMEALKPALSAISNVVLNFAVRPIHKTLVSVLSLETLDPFEGCVWGGVLDDACPVGHINKLLKLIGKQIPGTKGVKQQLVPQVNKIFILIAEQFPSPLVNAVRDQLVSMGYKAKDPEAKNQKALEQLIKAADPKSGVKLSQKEAMVLVEKAQKTILPSDTRAQQEILKLAQVSTIPVKKRTTPLGGAVVTPDTKLIKKSVETHKEVTKDPVKALQAAAVSKNPMPKKDVELLVKMTQNKIPKPRNPTEAKQIKKAHEAVKVLAIAASNPTPIKTSSAIMDVKQIKKAIPVLNKNDKVKSVPVNNKTLPILLSGAVKKVEAVKQAKVLKQETKQSKTPSCVIYKPDSTGISQKCYNELWNLSCPTNAPNVDPKKSFKNLASDIDTLSKLTDLANIERCFGKSSSQYAKARQSIDAAIARDKAAAEERKVKLEAAVALSKASEKVVQAKNVQYAIQRQTVEQKQQLKIALQKGDTKTAKLIQAEVKKTEYLAQQSAKVTQATQKQEKVVKSENNISAITTVGDITKKLITAAGTQKGISKTEANKLRSQAIKLISHDNDNAINSLVDMATKKSNFDQEAATEYAKIVISSKPTTAKDTRTTDGFFDWFYKLINSM